MANLVFMGKTGLIGGEATKLDSIDGATLTDNDAAFVNVSNVQYIYRLDADSGAAESSPSVISPATNAGTKRWILQGLNGASLNMPGLSASLPVFTDGSKNLISKSVADTLTALGIGEWTDYLASSTVAGWVTASLTPFGSYIRYKRFRDLIHVVYSLTGNANTAEASFTLPVAAISDIYAIARTYDSTATPEYEVGYSNYSSSSLVVTIYRNMDGTAWNSTGNKLARGQFFYDCAAT